MRVSIDSFKLIEASKKCTRARMILQELFPEAFTVTGLSALAYDGPRIFPNETSVDAGFVSKSFMQIRTDGEFFHTAFYLMGENNNLMDHYYEWHLIIDSQIELCLIPSKFNRHFGEESFFNLSKLAISENMQLFTSYTLALAGIKDDDFFMRVRNDGEYKHRAFHLSRKYHFWELKKDKAGILCLIPIKL